MIRPFSRLSGTTLARPNLLVSISCIFVSLLCLIGCDASRNGVSGSKKPVDPVKADFDWAMERLRRAIETFTPPAGLGLRVKRKLSFEFFPPSESKTDYTAKVFVESNSAFEPRRFASSSDEELEQDEDPLLEEFDNGFDGEFTSKRENDPTAFLKDLPESSQRKSKGVSALLKAPSIKERTVYELVYREERWQLVSEPESKHEQLWFEYALQH